LILVIIIIALVIYNVFSMEMQKIENRRELEEEARREIEMLEEIKSEEAREIAEYYQKFRPLKDEFIEKTVELSEELDSEFINVGQLKELASKRRDAVTGYREKLLLIENIPAPLETFYNYELEFIDSDIETINLVLSYYESGNYSTFDEPKIEKLYLDTEALFIEAEKEMKRVFENYGLVYILEGAE